MVTDIARQVTAAEGFMDLGDPMEAAHILDSLPERAQGERVILFLRLRIFAAIEAWQKVKDLSESMLRQTPHSTALGYALTVALTQLGQMQAAREVMQRTFAEIEEVRVLAMAYELLKPLWQEV